MIDKEKLKITTGGDDNIFTNINSLIESLSGLDSYICNAECHAILNSSKKRIIQRAIDLKKERVDLIKEMLKKI